MLGAVHSGAELLADGHVVVSNLTLTLTLTLPLPLSLIRHIVVCGELSGRAFCGQAGSRDAQIVATGRFDDTAIFGTTTLTSNGPHDIFVTHVTSDGVLDWGEGEWLFNF